jgi:uncharacterized protein involved in outer membrane biogenesis
MSKLFKIFLTLLVLYALAGFFFLPKLLVDKIPKLFEENFNAKLKLSSLYLNPFTFTARLSGIEIDDIKKQSLLEMDYIEIDVDPTALLFGEIDIHGIYLKKPYLYVERFADGSFNFSGILKENKEKQDDKAETKIPHIVLDDLEIDEGCINISDAKNQKEPYKITLHNILLTLKDLDTKSRQKGSIVLKIKIDEKGELVFNSKIVEFEPLQLDGSIGVELGELEKFYEYIQKAYGFSLVHGRASFFSKFSYKADKKENAKFHHMNFSLYDIVLNAKRSNQELLYLDYLYLNDIELAPFAKNIHIPHAGVKTVRVALQRDTKGNIDWQEYLHINSEHEQKKLPQKDKEVVASDKTWSIRVDDVALRKIDVDFHDAMIEPNVKTSLHDINISIKNIALHSKSPFIYDASFMLNKAAKCKFSGDVILDGLRVRDKAECTNIDIVHYRPYIDMAAEEAFKKYDLLLKSARLTFKADTQLDKENKNTYFRLNNGSLILKKFQLNQKSRYASLISLKELVVNNVTFNQKAKSATVGKVLLNHLHLHTKRQKNGRMRFSDIIKLKPKKIAKKEKEKRESFAFVLKDFRLQNAQVDFTDEKLHKRVTKSLNNVYLHVSNFDSKSGSWFYYNGSMNLNKKSGKLYLKGKLRHTPLAQKGIIKLKKFALKELNPYLEDRSYLKIKEGEFSVSFNESYKPSKKSANLRLEGNIVLEKLFTQNIKENNEALLSIVKLEAKPINFELGPNRLYVDNVAIDSLYLSAKVDQNKSFNLAQLVKENNSSVTDVQKHSSEKTEESFPIKINKLTIKNSNAFFSDLSLPIPFQANIHSLNGAVYGISSKEGETTYIDIDGEVNAYGSTKIKGSLDSFAPTEFTDINLNFQNLDLSNMSGYSATFAGYEIAEGKLFLDLGYKIKKAKLLATNSIVIKHIKLGKELDGEEGINHLPLGFVIALLEDSNGIIDIDLPIEGDVNNPDFKYGTIIWNTLTNLITKAVTSPFRFLGSMLGVDTKELEDIEFAYGSEKLLAPQREKLDTLASLLQKRPKIALKITPVYDKKADKRALQLKKLIALVVKRNGQENSEEGKTLLSIEVLEEIYDELKGDDKPEKIYEKLEKKYSDEKQLKREYQNYLVGLCRNLQTVTTDELEKLAFKRAVTIQKHLMKNGKIAMNRIQTTQIKSVRNSTNKYIKIELGLDIERKE